MRICIFLTFLISIFSVNANESEPHAFKMPEISTFLSGKESLEELTLLGLVNLSSGSLTYKAHLIDGGETANLPLDIYYNSSDKFGWNCAYSTYFSYPVSILLPTPASIGIPSYIGEELEGGSVIRYYAEKNNIFKIESDVFYEGITNVIGEEISGQTNLKNRKINWFGEGKSSKLIVSDGAGLKKTYTVNPIATMDEFVIACSEEHPNGLSIQYTPSKTKKDRFDEIGLKNRNGELIKSLKFNHTDSKKISISNTNGQIATLALTKVTSEISFITKIDRNHAPTENWYYYPSGKIKCFAIEDSAQIYFGYEIFGRVSEIHQRINGKLIKLYSIKYEPEFGQANKVTVEDCNKNKVIYSFSKLNRIESITYPNGIEKFTWGTKKTTDAGTLYSKELLDLSNNLLAKLSWEYDSAGNVTKFTSTGNITGLNQSSNLTTSTYSSDGLNLTLSKQIGNGPVEEYSYISGTNLLDAKYTLICGEIHKREFYTYDANASMTQKINDDGKSRDRSNLSGVTERIIEEITSITDPQSPGFGCPEAKRIGYVDLNSGKTVWLKKELFTYTLWGKVASQQVIGENDTYLYTLYFTYEDKGRLISETTPIGETIHHTYNKAFLRTSTQQEGSKFTTHFIYDDSGREIAKKIIYLDGSEIVTQKEYDIYGNCNIEIDRFGHKIIHEYDAMNREVKTIYPQSNNEKSFEIKREYDFFGNVIKEVNSYGDTTTKAYTILGKPTSITYPDQSKEEFFYDTDGNIIKEIHKNGSYTLREFDPFHRVIRESLFSSKNVELNWTTHVYSAFHLIRSQNRAGLITQYEYDGAGRLIRTKEIAKESIATKSFSYDAAGRKATEKHHLSENEWYGYFKIYDQNDRLIEEREEWSGELLQQTLFEYDSLDQLIKKVVKVDKNQDAITTYQYNEQKDLILEIDPLGNATTFEYNYEYINRYGHRTLQKIITDPLGQVTIEDHDVFGRMIKIEKFSLSSELISSIEKYYNQKGLETKESHSVYDGTTLIDTYNVDWEYDSMNQVTSETEQNKKRTDKEYDLSGNLVVVRLPSGIHIHNEYDEKNKLIRTYSSDGTVDQFTEYDFQGNPIRFGGKEIVNREYNLFGQIASETIDGQKISFAYDSLKRLESIVYPDGSTAKYTFRNGRIHQIKRIDSSKNHTFYTDEEYNLLGAPKKSIFDKTDIVERTYDQLGRKITTSHAKWSQKITEIDSVGNLKNMMVMDTQFEYEYDDLYQLKNEKGLFTHSHSFDSINNCIARDAQVHWIDDLNRLIANGDTSFEYDKDGKRIKKGDTTYRDDALGRLIEIKNNGVSTLFSYDSFNRRISSETGISKERYLYQGNLEIGLIKEGKIKQLRLLRSRKFEDIGSGAILELEGVIYFPLYDHRGNLSALINKKGQLVERNFYSAFGERNTQSKIMNPWRFSSKREDSSGLIYFGERYYDPMSATWLTPDPIGFKDGPNLYAYLGGNPLFSLDPTGLEKEKSNWDRCFRGGRAATEGFYRGYVETAESAKELYSNKQINANEYQGFDSIIYRGALLLGAGTNIGTTLHPLYAPTKIVLQSGIKIAAKYLLKTEAVQTAKKAVTNLSLKTNNKNIKPAATDGKTFVQDRFSREPKTIQDKFALAEAKTVRLDKERKNGTCLINDDLDDSRYKNMQKWGYTIKSQKGRISEVHFVYDPKTETRMDFKFKVHSNFRD